MTCLDCRNRRAFARGVSLTWWSTREKKVRAIAETLWQRDPLSFLALCAVAKERGTTLLARIRQRMAELEASR
jgi:DNA polymerase IIIc chi subunit